MTWPLGNGGMYNQGGGMYGQGVYMSEENRQEMEEIRGIITHYAGDRNLTKYI